MKTSSEAKSIYLLCPVRNATDKETKFLEKYAERLRGRGIKVHYPKQNTDQSDPRGIRICRENCNAIRKADEVHVFWNPKSSGSIFDLGMAFALEKKIVLIKPIAETKGKSFENVLIDLANQQ